MADLIDRLASKFTVGDGCWEWVAGKGSNGYGLFRVGSRRVCAHRVVYEALTGPIPEGLELDHLCRNRGCVRPDHLEPVTRVENVRRAGHRPSPEAIAVGVAKARAIKLARTHCPHGHEFTPENTHVNKNGARCCRTCGRAATRKFRLRTRAGDSD